MRGCPPDSIVGLSQGDPVMRSVRMMSVCICAYIDEVVHVAARVSTHTAPCL